MIEVALRFLKDELLSYLHGRGISRTDQPPLVKLSAVVDDTGKYISINPGDSNGVYLTLINIEEERIIKAHMMDYVKENGHSMALEPELRLNLVVMFAANFKSYETALTFLSAILRFFQGRPCFTCNEYAGLDPQIRRLTPELISPSFEQLNQIWAFLGAKQLPALFYRVRTVAIRDDPAAPAPELITTIITRTSTP